MAATMDPVPEKREYTLYFKSAKKIPKDLESIRGELPLVILRSGEPSGLIFIDKDNVIRRLENLQATPESNEKLMEFIKENKSADNGVIKEDSIIFNLIKSKGHYFNEGNKYVRKVGGKIVVDEEKFKEWIIGQRKVDKISSTSDPRNQPDDIIDAKSQLGRILNEMISTEKDFLIDMEVFYEILLGYREKLYELMGQENADKYINEIKGVIGASRNILETMENTFSGKTVTEIKKNIENFASVIAINTQKFISAIHWYNVFTVKDPEDYEKHKALDEFLNGLIALKESGFVRDGEKFSEKTTLERQELFKRKLFDQKDGLKKVASYDKNNNGNGFVNYGIKIVQRACKYPLLAREIYKNLEGEPDFPDAVFDEIVRNPENYVDMSESDFQIYLKKKIFPAWEFLMESNLEEANKVPYFSDIKELKDAMLTPAKKMMKKKGDSLSKEEIPSEFSFTPYFKDFDPKEYLTSLVVEMQAYQELKDLKISQIFGDDNNFNFTINGVSLLIMRAVGPDPSTGLYNLELKINNDVIKKYKKELSRIIRVMPQSAASLANKHLHMATFAAKPPVPADLTATTAKVPAPAAPIAVPPADLSVATAGSTPAVPVDKTSTTVTPAAPTTLTSTPLADDLEAAKKGVLSFKASGSHLPQRTNSVASSRTTPSRDLANSDDEVEENGREQRLGKGSGFTISSALIHHLQKVNRGQVLFADCDTEKEYNHFADRGIEQMSSARSELFERRDKTKSRLAAYRDYYDGLTIHEIDDQGVEKIIEEDGGMMIRRYNEAEKRAEIVVKPGSDRIILATLEANQYIQPLKIKIPSNQGKPVTEKDLNKGDMEFLLKTLVAGKLSGIPVTVDRTYQAMIAKRFPEVIQQIERIKAIEKEDIKELIESKSDYELSDLVDLFADRGNKRAREVDPNDPDEDDGNRKRKRP